MNFTLCPTQQSQSFSVQSISVQLIIVELIGVQLICPIKRVQSSGIQSNRSGIIPFLYCCKNLFKFRYIIQGD